MKITDKKKVQKVVQAINGIIDLTDKDIKEINFKEGKIMKAPEWFKEFEKKNDARWDKNDQRWEKQTEFNGNVSKFIKQQLEFNGNVSKFMENQMAFNEKLISLPTIKRELANS